MKETIIAAKRELRECPPSESRRVARILYGYPDFSPVPQWDLESGKIVLAGCVVADHDPA